MTTKKTRMFLLLCVALLSFAGVVYAQCTVTESFYIQVFDPNLNLVAQSKNMSIFPVDAGSTASCNRGNDTSVSVYVNCQMAGNYTANITTNSTYHHPSQPNKNVTVFHDNFENDKFGNWSTIVGSWDTFDPSAISNCNTVTGGLPSQVCLRTTAGGLKSTIQLKNNISLRGFDYANITFFYGEDDGLEPTDCLTIEMSNGTSWDNISTVFCSEVSPAKRDVSIPSKYLMDNVSIRFNWSVSDDAEDVYLDNITITGFYNAKPTVNVLTCYAPEDNKFVVRNQSSDPIAAFDEKGYLFLRGFNYSNQANLNPPKNSYIIKNNTGNVVAFIDSKGNLNITGQITKQSHILSPPKNSFVVMNRSRNVVAYISDTGNLFLEGNIYFNWTGGI